MPNPYEDFFNDSNKEPQKESPKEEFDPIDFSDDDQFVDNGKEPLDEVLDSVNLFREKAEAFSKLLSETKAVDHRVINNIARLFLVSEDKHDQESLDGEKSYHELLRNKFTAIIQPMKDLAKIHLATVKQFNRDIDKDYYSIEKLDRQVKMEKSQAIDGINLQRQILADAADDLQILESALADTEKRIRNYIDAGGENNISKSELALLKSNRESLTAGRSFQFDYSFFKINMIDKTAISLGVYLKETTAQYLGKLMQAFEIK